MTRRPLALLGLLTACSPTWPGGPLVMTDGDGFFDRPWPSDTRTVGGHPDLDGFPQQGDIPLVDSMIAEAEALTGFGLASPLYLRFTEPVDPARLPSPAESLDPENGLFLVDVDPTSPERGRRIPLTWDLQSAATTWQPEDLLALQPVWGLPLQSSTTYALVLTRHGFDPVRLEDGDDFDAVFDPRHPRFAEFSDLSEVLLELGVTTEAIAFASVFTTQDAVGDMARIVERMDAELPLVSLEPTLRYWWGNDRYQAYSGHVRVPIWQRGEAPYTSEGGAFVIDDRGWPTLVTLERVQFTLTVPRDQQPPAAGWPVVLYSHGTGGSRASFANSSSDMEVASVLAARGIAGIGISLPFHGDRYLGGNESILSFNYLNPESGRTAFRQAALEQIWLSRVLTEQTATLAGPNGFEATLDPDRVAYMGHSHGAEIGVIAAPYFGERVRGVVLSGAGGGLSVSIVEREAEDFDIQGLLTTALGFGPDEALDVHHPVVGLVQFVADATDPLHYAPLWHRQGPSPEAAPQNVLLIHGLLDIHTPPATVGALAAAAHTPILAPIGETWLAQEFVDPGDQQAPAQANLTAWDGSVVTGGVLQYPEQDHFAIFQDPDAARAYGDFIEAALGDGAVIPQR